MNASQFFKFFIAGLVRAGCRSFRINSRRDRERVGRVESIIKRMVDKKIKEAMSSKNMAVDKELRELLSIHKYFIKSSVGSYDKFEGALRNMQYVYTSSENPTLDVIKFNIDKRHADSIWKEISGTEEEKFMESIIKGYLPNEELNNEEVV